MTKKIQLTAVPVETECNYPSPFDLPCLDQSTQRLARLAGLTQFSVNLTVIQPGAWSSQRHWHSHEDELVWVLEGELTLSPTAVTKCCVKETAPPSEPATPMATTSSTNLASLPGYSRSVTAIRGIVASIRI
jgi:hypothetical protein